MNLFRLALLSAVVAFAADLPSSPAAKPQQQFIEGWLGRLLRNGPEWFASAEAARVADNLLLYQRENGGWPKGKDAHRTLSAQEAAAIGKQKRSIDTTLDNGATHTQIRFLARVYAANPQPRFREGVLRGIDWLLAAQYPNGGWPQCWPDFVHTNQPADRPGLKVSRRNPRGLTRFVTFNDGVMTSALRLLDAVARSRPEFAFVDEIRRRKAADAVARGVQCVLRCQVRVGDKLTVWGGQHDVETLEPRWGRTFEPVALTASESVGVVRFLMDIEKPSPQVVASVEAAVRWFESARIPGIRLLRQPAPASPRGFDLTVATDPDAAGLWARFYEIGTDRPLFGDHDDFVHHNLSDISVERRTGYAWYGSWPEDVIRAYPAWRSKLRCRSDSKE